MAPATTNGTANGTAKPKIMLYTNHRCPWAHRAHITLAELGLPFEETIIDLDTPRPQWYLDINPRGLVPAMKYTLPGVVDTEQIITESGTVSQFLSDSFPSNFLPGSHEAPLRRARIGFFVDTWFSKLTAFQMNAMKADSAEKAQICSDWAAAIEKEIEPLLADAAPFFGGSKHLTFAEAMVAPFVLRWYSFARDGSVIPAEFMKKVEALPNFSKWAKAVTEHKHVTEIYNEQEFVAGFMHKYGKVAKKV